MLLPLAAYSHRTGLTTQREQCVSLPTFLPIFSPLTTLVGITQYTKKGHIARATLEATCYQTKAILDAMEKDSGQALSELAVDGGMSNSDLAMQVQLLYSNPANQS